MKVTIERSVVNKTFTVGELVEWQGHTEQYVVMVIDTTSGRYSDGFKGVVIQSTCKSWNVGDLDENFINSEFTKFEGKLIIEV